MSDIIKQQDSRRAFVDTLDELAKSDKKIIVLIPDVGFNYLDNPKLNFPVINTGVTEQSTVAIAAGMALHGYKPYVYSMINFVLFRPAEMIRNCVVNHNANVKLIGVKGSEKYKFLGKSHNLLHEQEDTNFCQNINLDWITPNASDVSEATKYMYDSDSPYYMRLP